MAQILPFAQAPPPEPIGLLIAFFAFVVIIIFVFLTPALTALWFRDRIFSRDLRKAKKHSAQRLRKLAEQGEPEALYGLAIFNASKGMVLAAQLNFRIENVSDWFVHFQVQGKQPLKWSDQLRSELIKAGEMGSIRAKMTLAIHLTESGAPTADELWR